MENSCCLSVLHGTADIINEISTVEKMEVDQTGGGGSDSRVIDNQQRFGNKGFLPMKKGGYNLSC